MTEAEKQLQQERKKLTRLIDESLQHGTLFSEEVLAQSYIVDELILKVEQEKEQEK